MSSALDGDLDEGWCIDTDGLDFGIRRNEKYFSSQLTTKAKTEKVTERDSLYPLRNSFRHSYVNTNSNEDAIEREILNSTCVNVEKIINKEHIISYNGPNDRRNVCKRSKYTSHGIKKSLRIGIISMVSYHNVLYNFEISI